MACVVPGNFLRASYKGVDFYVESAEDSGGRRLAKHEYPNAEHWYVEDLGVDTPTFKGTAYLAGDGPAEEVYAASQALRAACNSGGSGRLVLPPDIFTDAQCDSFTRKWEKDKQGFIAFELEFVGDDGLFGGAPFAIGAGLAARLIAQAIVSVIEIVAESGRNYFATARPSYEARIAASDNIRVSVAALDMAYVNAVPLPDRAAETPPLFRALLSALDAFDNADDDAAPDAYTQVVETYGAYAISVVDTTSQPVIMADSLQQTALIIIEPPDSVGLAVYVDRTVTTAFSDEWNAAIAQATAFSGVLSGMVMAQAYADSDYATRRGAQVARGRMVATVNTIVAQLAPDNPGIDGLSLARNQAARAIADKLAKLKPRLTVSFPMSLPALYIAQRLYRDPLRAEELAALNNAPHPLFMPAEIEAEAVDARSLDTARKR